MDKQGPPPATAFSDPSATVADIMTTDVQVVGPYDTLPLAARLIDQLNVGSLPVCDNKHLLGMVADREITIRGTAMNLAPDHARVAAVMMSEVEFCTDDQDAPEVLLPMGKALVRRLPVINVDRRLVGARRRRAQRLKPMPWRWRPSRPPRAHGVFGSPGNHSSLIMSSSLIT
jgi:CBS domain-containing protein